MEFYKYLMNILYQVFLQWVVVVVVVVVCMYVEQCSVKFDQHNQNPENNNGPNGSFHRRPLSTPSGYHALSDVRVLIGRVFV